MGIFLIKKEPGLGPTHGLAILTNLKASSTDQPLSRTKKAITSIVSVKKMTKIDHDGRRSGDSLSTVDKHVLILKIQRFSEGEFKTWKMAPEI